MIQSPAGYQGDVRIKRYLDFYQAGYGVAMLSSGVAFSPLSLFANGEQGGWYDPSDLTTLFQDAAGTTPVTAVEQPVGLVLDKSKGLVLGSEINTSPTTWTASAGWTNNNDGSYTGTNDNSIYKIIGGVTTSTYYEVTLTISSYTSGSVVVFLRGNSRTVGSGNGTKTVRLFSGTSGDNNVYIGGSGSFNGIISNISIKQVTGNHLSQSTSTARPVLSARVNALVNTATLSTQNVTTLATNYTLRFEGTGSIALSGTGSGTYSAGVHTVTCTAGTLTLTVTGSVTNADLRPSNAGVGLPAYQRVTTATDYDTTGFPYYLKFDGTDDSLSSASIDFSATDNITFFAGVRKLADNATAQIIAELNTGATSSNRATLGGFIDGTPQTRFFFASGGTSVGSAETSSAAFAAPVTAVTTGEGDISSDLSRLRVNGTQVATSLSDQGTGDYPNAALYIGFRSSGIFRFNGHLYSLIVRGAATDAATIASTETWVNSKTGAY